MATDFGQIPRQSRAYNDQQSSLKNKTITAGPIGNPFSRVALPTVKRVPPPIAKLPSMISGAANAVKNFFPSLGSGWGGIVRAAFPTPTPTVTPSPMMTPTPTATPTPNPTQQLIDRGFSHFGNPPAATLSGVMAQESAKYPILQQHPELLPIISILESGGMKHMPGEVNSEFPGKVTNENRQFNGYGWGLNPDFKFNPTSPEAVIRKVAEGIATKPQFAKFRQTGKIEDLAQVYSPYHPVTNPHGGEQYVRNYNDIAQWFK